MKIIEVRDGYIVLESEKETVLSSFVRIIGQEKNYIAQIVKVKKRENSFLAQAKFLFLFNGETLQVYDKTLPPIESEVQDFSFKDLIGSVETTNPIIAGKMLSSEDNIVIDSSAFNKKMLICMDDAKDNNILIRNLVKQFKNLKKRVVIIDTIGVVDANKYVAGVDFKLPLNTKSLEFLYEECLNDATQDSKALIIEIFKDLADYSETVPFVPFGTLKSIIDEMVDKSHIFKLLVLKNKLAKLDKLNYFAQNKSEVDKLSKILNSECAVIDLSKLDSIFQNRYLSLIYDCLQDIENVHVFLELSNVINKRNLKSTLTNEGVSTTILTHSKFKYLDDMKSLFDNFIISPSLTSNEIFKIYGTFLKAMPKNTFLIAGEALNYIPLISDLKVIDDVMPMVEDLEKDSSISVVGENNESSNEEDVEESLEELEGLTEEQEDSEISQNIDAMADAVISEVTKDFAKPQNIFDDEEDDEENNEINANDLAEEIDEIGEIEEIKQGISNDIEIEEASEKTEELFGNEEVLLEADENIIATEELDNTTADGLTVEDTLAEEDILSDNLEDNALENSDLQEINENRNISQEAEKIENLEMALDDSDINLNEEISNSAELEEIHEEVEIPEGLDIEVEDIQLSDFENIQDNSQQDEFISDNNENDDNGELKVIPISNDEEFSDVVELNPDEIEEDDIIVDLSDENENQEIDDENIVKDVDKVFTTVSEDDLSDSDLDLIDELNSETEEDALIEEHQDDSIFEELTEEENTSEGILEEVSDSIELKENENNEILETRNTSTPIVPVYDAEIPQEEIVMSDQIEQGDAVFHAKYGNGVVEKMIKYGNKTLFSINFDNIGRRLLDPTLTEIKKA